MVRRKLTETILKTQREGFATLIYGPRRVGKTVLLGQILERYPSEKKLILDGDTQETRDLLGTTSETKLSRLAEGLSLLVVDEAQRIPNIGLSLKIIIDRFPKLRIFASGSSSLELSRGVQENLTGRTQKFRLFPLSTAELLTTADESKAPYLLESQLIYGGYPYLLNLKTDSEKQSYLSSLVADYLFRDLFDLETVNNRDVVRKLATLLAFQVGNQVSLNELSQKLVVSVKTVARYLSLLESCFVVFPVGAYSTNLRNEVARSRKYYFYDLGIRNALTGQFHPLDSRADVGALWENFLVIERLKKFEHQPKFFTGYFWRDYAQAEVDWVEQDAAGLTAFEFRYRSAIYRTPKAFSQAYHLEASLVSRENYLEFIL